MGPTTSQSPRAGRRRCPGPPCACDVEVRRRRTLSTSNTAVPSGSDVRIACSWACQLVVPGADGDEQRGQVRAGQQCRSFVNSPMLWSTVGTSPAVRRVSFGLPGSSTVLPSPSAAGPADQWQPGRRPRCLPSAVRSPPGGRKPVIPALPCWPGGVLALAAVGDWLTRRRCVETGRPGQRHSVRRASTTGIPAIK